MRPRYPARLGHDIVERVKPHVGRGPDQAACNTGHRNSKCRLPPLAHLHRKHLARFHVQNLCKGLSKNEALSRERYRGELIVDGPCQFRLVYHAGHATPMGSAPMFQSGRDLSERFDGDNPGNAPQFKSRLFAKRRVKKTVASDRSITVKLRSIIRSNDP